VRRFQKSKKKKSRKVEKVLGKNRQDYKRRYLASKVKCRFPNFSGSPGKIRVKWLQGGGWRQESKENKREGEDYYFNWQSGE